MMCRGWKVYGKESKKKSAGTIEKAWAPPTHNPNRCYAPLGNADVAQQPGRASGIDPWRGHNGKLVIITIILREMLMRM